MSLCHVHWGEILNHVRHNCGCVPWCSASTSACSCVSPMTTSCVWGKIPICTTEWECSRQLDLDIHLCVSQHSAFGSEQSVRVLVFLQWQHPCVWGETPICTTEWECSRQLNLDIHLCVSQHSAFGSDQSVHVLVFLHRQHPCVWGEIPICASEWECSGLLNLDIHLCVSQHGAFGSDQSAACFRTWMCVMESCQKMRFRFSPRVSGSKSDPVSCHPQHSKLTCLLGSCQFRFLDPILKPQPHGGKFKDISG